MSKFIRILIAVTFAAPCLRAAEKPAFPAATPESQGIPAALLKPITDEIAGYVKADTIVGAELLIIKNRKTIFHEAYGLRDRDDKLPMERNTIFNVRSMTKPLTGAAIQILVDEGKLRLDDAVAKHLPSFDNDKSRAITVKQLLGHRSGLPLTGLVFVRQFKDLQAQVKSIGEKGPQFKPNEKFWYSDAGSDTAAAIVEKITGTTIDQFVSDRLLGPLGMTDSFYPSKSDDPRTKRIGSLYTGGPRNWKRMWKPGGEPMYPFAWGSQTLYSTPVDYARFLAMWLDGGKAGDKQILSNEAVKRILTPTSAMTMLGTDAPFPTRFEGVTPYYGQMSVLHASGQMPNTKLFAIGHSGSDGTIAWAFPEHDLIVCYFTQSRGQNTVIRLEATIERQLLRKGAPPPAAPEALRPYLGIYLANFGPFKNAPFEVLHTNGRLALDIPDQLAFELKPPDNDGRWVFVLSDKIWVIFKKDDAGKVTGMTLHRAG